MLIENYFNVYLIQLLGKKRNYNIKNIDKNILIEYQYTNTNFKN